MPHTHPDAPALREEFEAAMRANGFSPADFKNVGGRYVSAVTHGAWIAWQACAARQWGATAALTCGPQRGDPCEVQDGDPDSPTHRQWFPARFIALDLIGGEPIVQRDGRMPSFATWGSVRGIAKPSQNIVDVQGAVYSQKPDGRYTDSALKLSVSKVAARTPSEKGGR